MAKLSHSVVKRPQRQSIDVVFTDPPRGEKGKPGYYPGNPDLVLAMKLRKLGGMEWAAARDHGNELTVRYVTGIGEPDTPGYVAPEILPPVDGQPVFPCNSTCTIAATLAFAQIAEADDRYTAEELLGFMTVDAVLLQMSHALDKLQPTDGDEEVPNSPLA